jgi:hypothetical protein
MWRIYSNPDPHGEKIQDKDRLSTNTQNIVVERRN